MNLSIKVSEILISCFGERDILSLEIQMMIYRTRDEVFSLFFANSI